jgi:hypothetical protein
MGKISLKYLDGTIIYCCKECKAHLVDRDELVSKVSKNKLIFRILGED